MSFEIPNIQKVFEEEVESEISDSEEEIGEEELFLDNASPNISEESSDQENERDLDIDIAVLDEPGEQWFISKDQNEVWCSQPFRCFQGRKKAWNVVKEKEGPTRWARHNVITIADSFLLFFRKQLIEMICKWTNKEGRQILGNKWQDMDPNEAKKYIGLLILMGACKSKNEDVAEMFGNEMGRPILGKIMCRNRFKEITRAMRFDDAENRRKIQREDKLAPIREFLDIWNDCLRDAYIPGSTMTVDEQLVTFKGRCPFRQYMPMKPGKYGINFWVLCDSMTSYVWKVQLYTGKEPGGKRELNQGERVVKDLVSNIHNSGRNITGDNFFTCLPLARYLTSKKLTIVGTIRKNKGCLPLEFVSSKNRNVGSTMFGFQDDCMLASYCPKKGKVVTLLSTFHETGRICDTNKKPEIVQFYNDTKFGVDRADQMIRNYSCKRKTRRWPMAVFSNIIDISALNAFIVYSSLFPNTLGTKSGTRRRFLINLGKQLAGLIIEEPSEEVSGSGGSVPVTLALKKRCYVCPSKINRKQKTVCAKCGKNICKEHSVVMCHNCK